MTSSVKTKMDPKLKTKWIAALRSGRYRQGKNALQNPDGTNCCLGVLCRVARRPKGEWILSAGLPEKTSTIFALDEFKEGLLASANDGTGEFRNNPQSFSQIADYIEESL